MFCYRISLWHNNPICTNFSIMDTLNEGLTLKGRIAIRNYLANTNESDISWDNFNASGSNTCGITEDDFIEGIGIFNKNVKITKSEPKKEPEAPVEEPKKPEEPKPVETKPVEDTPVETAPEVTSEEDDPDGETPEETVAAPSDAECEKELAKDDASEAEEIDLGNDVNHGIYKIYKGQWPYLYDNLLRCKKKMGAEFDFKIIGEDVVHQRQLYTSNPFESWQSRSMPFWGNPEDIPVYVIEITSKVKENNWVVVAIVQHAKTQSGITISPLPGGDVTEDMIVNIPKEYNFLDNIACDHCNTHRDRSLGFIVYNTETKEYRMIGRSCMKEYTGIDPTGLLALAHVFNVARHWDPLYTGAWARKYYDISDALLLASAATKLYGYVKRNCVGEDRWHKIYDGPANATLEVVKRILEGTWDAKENTATRELDTKVIQYANEHYKELMSFKDEVVNYINNMDIGYDVFKQNLKTALSGTLILKKQLGLVVCAPSMYSRFLADEEKKKAFNDLPRNNEFYPGNRGDIIKIENIVSATKSPKPTSRGSYILTFLTEDGYELSAFVDPNDIPEDLTKITSVVGKIYNFNEFRGKKSTTLVNVKFHMENEDYFGDSIAAVKPLGNLKDKITFTVAKVQTGPVRSFQVSWNNYASYMPLTLIDNLGNKIIWNCYNDDIYDNANILVGKQVTGTIKKIERDVEGNISSYKIGGRVKVDGIESSDENQPISESNEKLTECHFSELPRNKHKKELQAKFDSVIDKTLEKLNEPTDEQIEACMQQQAAEDEALLDAFLDCYEYDEGGWCDGFAR